MPPSPGTAPPTTEEGKTTFWQTLIRQNARLIAEKLEAIAEALELAAPGPPATVVAGWQATITNEGGTALMGSLTMKDNDPAATAAVTFQDADGNPTAPDDIPAWSADDGGTIVTLTPAADGLSASVAPVGALGTANISMTSTDTNGTVVSATGDVTVVSSEAATADIEFTPGV